MRHIKTVLILLGIVFISSYASGSPVFRIYQSERSTLLLQGDKDSTLLLFAYGGGLTEYADCAIQAECTIVDDTLLQGILVDVDVNIATYYITGKNYPISGIIRGDKLVLSRIKQKGFCAEDISFIDEYTELTKIWKITNAIEEMKEIMHTPSSDTVFKELKAATQQDIFLALFNEHYKEALQLYKASKKKDAAKLVHDFFMIRGGYDSIVLSKEYLTELNDLAFFLEQGGMYTRAIPHLYQILKIAPNRTVAYLNMGDAYVGYGDTTKAQEFYDTYISQMKEKGMENKIPARLLK